MSEQEQAEMDALIQDREKCRRLLQRAWAETKLVIPEAAQNLQALLDKRIKDDAGLVAEENAVLVDEALTNDLLKLVIDESIRKLQHMPTPRMVIETKGEAKFLLDQQQRELDNARYVIRGIATTLQQVGQTRNDELLQAIKDLTDKFVELFPEQPSDEGPSHAAR